MNKPTYSWSSNCDTYTGDFGSIDEAVQDAFDSGVDAEGVNVGENNYIDAARLVSAGTLIDQMQEAMCQFVGEAGDSFLTNVSREQRTELEQLIAAWVRTVDTAQYWEVENATFHRFAEYGLRREAE
ncbi:hypothetical protein [Stenotrophomonas muris]|jgi:hypothetical protein|uniref:hypothetical protein n=1 Tax=Stenotrophomonas muris TaxID=2963283 RepID=UPI0028314157|nr:hypothetical protein [Stenotrophomonas muris]MDR0256602.1 hypothetical protein [Stenotrophomonas maltophilia]